MLGISLVPPTCNASRADSTCATELVFAYGLHVTHLAYLLLFGVIALRVIWAISAGSMRMQINVVQRSTGHALFWTLIAFDVALAMVALALAIVPYRGHPSP